MASSPPVIYKTNENLQAVIRPLFVNFIKPCAVLVHFRSFLTPEDFERVQSVTKYDSNIAGAQSLFDIITQKCDWFASLLTILRTTDLKLHHIANMMNEEKKFFECLPTGQNGLTSMAGDPPLSSLYIEYNKTMERDIEKLFLKCVDPSITLPVFHNYSYNVLTEVDIQNVNAEIKNHGPHAGAQKLLERLILYENWFDVLLQVLKDPKIQPQSAANEMESLTANTRKWYEEEKMKIDQMYAPQYSDEIQACVKSVDGVKIQDKSNNNLTANTNEEYESDSAAGKKFQDETKKNICSTTRLSGEYDSLDTDMNCDISDEHLYASPIMPERDECPLQAKGSVKGSDKMGRTELIAAARAGNADLLMTLINTSDINEKDSEGRTALMHAALKDYSECLELLIICGCDVNIQDCNGNTALMIAIGENNIQCVKILASSADVDKANNSGSTALMVAAKKGHVACMKLLLKKNCDINKQHNDDLTALIYAARYGQSECLKLLLEQQCDINKSSKAGQTALMFAAKYGHLECVRLLIEAGSDVNMCDNKGQTALIFAADSGHCDILELLINGEADIDRQGPNGDTALMFAILSDHPECVQFLVKKNANPNIVNKNGYTPLRVGRKKGYL